MVMEDWDYGNLKTLVIHITHKLLCLVKIVWV